MGTDVLRELYSRKTQLITKDGPVLLDGADIMTVCVERYYRRAVKGCAAPPVMMSGYFAYKDSSNVIKYSPVFAGEYKSDSLLEKDTIGAIHLGHSSMFFVNKDDERLTAIKTVFKTQCRNDYFYIPLKIIPLVHTNISSEVSKSIPAHANGILIRRSKGTVMRIEPQNSPDFDSKINNAINAGIIKLVNEIGLINPTFVELNDVCPQAITKDTNCAFWTMFIFKEILQNIFKKDPNTVISEMTKRTDLPAVIENFKKELATTVIPSQLNELGYRWPEFDTLVKGFPLVGQAPKLGGKNGKSKHRFRKTKRKHGVYLRKTGKAARSN